jgi:ketosteroid isomerase-like protein
MSAFQPEATEREVRSAFDSYERALAQNDVDALDEWFWSDERLVRFGIAEIQHGAREVIAWRRTSAGVPPDRAHERVTVTAFDKDTAVVALEFRNGTSAELGRQSQLWRRMGCGWRIVHAHVSMIVNG